MLSEKARKKKIAYNNKRLKEYYKSFNVRLPKDEYQEICDFLKAVEMNKAEFIRWAYDELRGK